MNRPTPAQREAARHPQPGRRTLMHQRWEHLLFLHWTIDREVIQHTLPPGLHADTFAGTAWLGLVPFAMRGVRPAGLPAIGPLSNFLELNVRTYVHDDQGVPGVWFYSLDCNQPLAVLIARTFFRLPYQNATMRAEYNAAIDYHCTRRDTADEARYQWQPQGPARPAPAGSLDRRDDLRIARGNHDRTGPRRLRLTQNTHDHWQTPDICQRLAGQAGRGHSRGDDDDRVHRLGMRRG